MYAKAIIPGPPVDVPLLVLVDVPGGNIVDQLRTLGWSSYGGEIVEATGKVLILPDYLELSTHQAILIRDSTNPKSPPGWWEAVDDLDSRVLVVVAEHGTVDLKTGEVGTQLVELVGSTRAAQATVKVTHD